MTLTELRYVIMLAQEKHFGRAAERCFVSQPTLSVAVKKLEDELGVTLFERHKGTISITEVGEQLVLQASKVLEQVQIFKDLAHQGSHDLSLTFRLGAIFTIGPYLFPHLMPALNEHAPEMPLYIEENYTAVLTEKLRNCSLDAVIVALPFEESDVVTMPIYDEPLVVILPKGHRLAAFEQLSGEQLLEDNLLMLGPGHCLREQIFESQPALQTLLDPTNSAKKSSEVRGESRLITEGSSLETIRHMVASGLGISVLPLSAVAQQDRAQLEIRAFSSPAPYRTVALAWRATYPRVKAIDVLSQALKSIELIEHLSERLSEL